MMPTPTQGGRARFDLNGAPPRLVSTFQLWCTAALPSNFVFSKPSLGQLFVQFFFTSPSKPPGPWPIIKLKRSLRRDSWAGARKEEECEWPQMGIVLSLVAGGGWRSFVAVLVVSHWDQEKLVREDFALYTSDLSVEAQRAAARSDESTCFTIVKRLIAPIRKSRAGG